MADSIRDLFTTRRPIDRAIEKVIDYYAQEESRLAAEIEEYEVTGNVEDCFQRFLENFNEGIRTGQATEIGIWVSGFYGSGKSSFTKYLGFALDPNKKVGGRPFLDLLCERFTSTKVPAELRTTAQKYPTAIVLLDLGAEQLGESASVPVSSVLYWKVLQWAGFSKEKKLAEMEFTLEKRGKLDEFKQKYRERFNEDWEEIHNDPMLGVHKAAEIVPEVIPEFESPHDFRSLRFELAKDVRDLARDIIDLCRRRTGCENILILIDEAGQYVAPRGELILNMDGLARNLKELGQGKVWIAATGQQTLSEIVERAAHNSAELNKLRDRFPISIHLDASDIREITYRRLLTKSEESQSRLEQLFAQHGQALATHTRLAGTNLYRGDPDASSFGRLYPFLPQHFDLLLELIRTLARSTGGIGLRSAIRVIQDVLVDKSRVLPAGAVRLADREVGTLACVDDFYDTLRADIAKVLPHVVAGVDKAIRIFGDRPVAQRVAKAVAALQPVENFPRTAENIAALLYPGLGAPSLQDEVREALRLLVAERECGLIEDPQAGGYVFLSDAVKPIREKRNGYPVSSGETNAVRVQLLSKGEKDCPLFSSQPSARLENVKEVRAAVRYQRTPSNLLQVVGAREDVEVRLEFVDPSNWQARRTELLSQTNTQTELRNAIVWLARTDDTAEELLAEIVRSESVEKYVDERTADSDVAQFLRSERRLAERNRERVAKALERALMGGTLLFRGKPTPAGEAGETLEAACRNVLAEAAKEVFHSFHLAALRGATDTARQFLEVERLDRMTRERDPLRFVIQEGGVHKVDVGRQALAEALRVFRQRIDDSGTNRLQGSFVQDLFSSEPYGWSKDVVRYIFAAALRAAEVEFNVPSADGPVCTPGPHASEAVKSTSSFNSIGISLRGSPPDPEMLDRAARRLEELFAIEVLPLEERISDAVRKHFPTIRDKISTLGDRLRLLGLAGEERAGQVLAAVTELERGDGSGATGLLGGNECPALDDIKWAQSAVAALNEGAEELVGDVQRRLEALDELEGMFPDYGSRLLSAEDRQELQGILASERFHERQPDLRGLLRKLDDATGQVYREERALYEGGLREALNRLQADNDWLRISEADREDLAEQLTSNVPESPDPVNPIRSLQLLLFRRDQVAGALERLREEVKRRVPQPEPEPGGGDEEVEEEVLPAASLVHQATISNMEELKAWLGALEARLTDILKQKKRIRIE